MELIISICVGLGLSTACGFRIFVPPLVMSIASHLGYVTLSTDFQWMGTDEALYAFAIATFIEVLAYYIPIVDNLLDTVSTPMAVAAGTLVTISVLPQGDPLLQWTVALIAGGGAAGTIQSFAGIARLISTATTGGLANALLATIESGSSFILAGLAIFVPLLTIGIVIVLLFLAFSELTRRLSSKVTDTEPSSQ
ncbi:MAG: DUF4126 domain-containing protein [Cyanophyceae cyanobacterium]